MRVLFNLCFRHCLVSRAGRVSCLLGAWGHGVGYRSSGSSRFFGRPAPRQISRPVTRMNQGRFVVFGSVRMMAAGCSGLESILSPSTFAFGAEPNKALEPTTFAVTSRAIEGHFEGRAWTDSRIAARAAPAKVVAHL
jgi:hypothetical protein